MQSQRRLTIAEIAEVTNIGEIRAKAVVEKLVEAGLVDASGNNKARFYILSSKVYKGQDNIVGYVRQTGIDAVKYEAWIMELIQKQGVSQIALEATDMGRTLYERYGFVKIKDEMELKK